MSCWMVPIFNTFLYVILIFPIICIVPRDSKEICAEACILYKFMFCFSLQIIYIYIRYAEIMDFGYPQNLSPEILKLYITQEGVRSPFSSKVRSDLLLKLVCLLVYVGLRSVFSKVYFFDRYRIYADFVSINF